MPCSSSDLSVLKAVSNANAKVGSTITFTILTTNAGSSDADGVVVNDMLSPGYNFVSYTVSSGTYNDGTGVWAIGNLGSGANATLIITAIVNEVVNFANTATVTGNQPDSDLTNNSSTSTPAPVNVIDAVDDTVTDALAEFSPTFWQTIR